jgi:transposase InsO family protein
MKRSRFTENQIVNILKEADAGANLRALDIVIDTSIPGGRVVRTLDQSLEWRGRPDAIRADNGPEYISQTFVDWCDENDYVERFNRTYRNEVQQSRTNTACHVPAARRKRQKL